MVFNGYPGANREVRIILSVISLIAAICFFLYNKYGPTFKQTFLENASIEVFHGKVDSIYNDVPNHNERIALLSDGYKLGLYPEWESKIALGDSLFKNLNSLKIKIHKKDGTKATLDYNEIAKSFRKDLQ